MKNAFELARMQVQSDMKGFFQRLDEIAEKRRQEAACVGCEGSPAPENNPCGVCGTEVQEQSADYNEGYHEGYQDGLNMGRELIEDIRAKVERLEAQLAVKIDERKKFKEWFDGLPEDEEGFKAMYGSRVNEGWARFGWDARSEVVK